MVDLFPLLFGVVEGIVERVADEGGVFLELSTEVFAGGTGGKRLD